MASKMKITVMSPEKISSVKREMYFIRKLRSKTASKIVNSAVHRPCQTYPKYCIRRLRSKTASTTINSAAHHRKVNSYTDFIYPRW